MTTRESVEVAKSLRPQGRSKDWRVVYARRLVVTDVIVIALALAVAQISWFGFTASGVTLSSKLQSIALSYTVVSVILFFAWQLSLSLLGTRADRVVGTGTQEYRLVVSASLRLFGIFAILAFLLQIDFSRGYFIIALPAGTLFLLLDRWIWRKWLNRRRLQGEFSAQVLLVGSEASVLHTARELYRAPEAGYHVVGACLPAGPRAHAQLPGLDVPVIGTVDEAVSALIATGADTIVITSSEELSHDRIKQISWELDPGRQHLVVAPSLTDIGGPRIHTRPVAGLPLIHVETPRYEGFKRYQKRLFDIVASALLILFLSPMLALIALIVRLSAPGRVLFRQVRVGFNGEHFEMLKFRSMVTDAESMLDELQQLERAEGNAVLFKMKDDPRVTPIGRVLRRYSLDELPQLFNVFTGKMSLIGPRPPLPSEVELYESHVHRRFLMKPGITGLWQVSGRSDLSWEDSVRLDLYYVENWSLVGDFVVLFKTARAVFAREGAY